MICNGIPRRPQKAPLPRILRHLTIIPRPIVDFVHFCLALGIHLRRLLDHDRRHLTTLDLGPESCEVWLTI